MKRNLNGEGTRMKRNLLFVLVSVITMFGIGVAHGKDCQGVNFPEQAQVDGSTLRLNGLGLRQATFLKVNVYVAALYVANVSSDPQALLGSNTPKELILHFLHNASDDDLKKAWEEGFAHNAKEQLPALHERIEMLKSWMADMKSGQRLTFLHKPGAGVQVDVNGTVKGLIKGDDFATAFLAIWLGPHPPNPGLKSGLLGGACE
jgi:Chalcone isomerase-like